jgi:hypothetical protein
LVYTIVHHTTIIHFRTPSFLSWKCYTF